MNEIEMTVKDEEAVRKARYLAGKYGRVVRRR